MPIAVKPLLIPVRYLLTALGFIQFAAQVLWLGKWRMPRLMKNGQDPVKQRQKALYSAHRNVVIYLRTLSRLKVRK